MQHLQRAVLLVGALLAGVPAQAQKPPPIGPTGPGPAAPPGGPRTSGEGFNLLGKPPPLGGPDASRGEARTDPSPDMSPRTGSERASSTGSGFVVAAGKVMTNRHVVDECARMVVRNAAGVRFPAKVEVTDRRRDLALMTVSDTVGPPLTFRDGPAVERGENVVTYGFPLSGLLSSGPTLTAGNVNALAGLRDNPVTLQIQAPVQPGNSGGPLLDGQANVIGVVVYKLNAMRTAEMTGGDIPQNVNFAVKGTEALAFLRANGVQPRTASSTGPDKRTVEIGQIADPSTVYVLCYR